MSVVGRALVDWLGRGAERAERPGKMRTREVESRTTAWVWILGEGREVGNGKGTPGRKSEGPRSKVEIRRKCKRVTPPDDSVMLSRLKPADRIIFGQNRRTEDEEENEDESLRGQRSCAGIGTSS